MRNGERLREPSVEATEGREDRDRPKDGRCALLVPWEFAV